MKKNILVIDDDLSLQEFYTQVFAAHVVRFCSSGEDAISQIESGAACDLIILDLDLLGMTGFSVLDKLKAMVGVKAPPVVVSSCFSDAEAQKRALDKGAVGFVPKPVNVDAILSLAQKFLGQSP